MPTDLEADILLKRSDRAALVAPGAPPGSGTLASGARSALSAEYDNQTGLLPFGEFELVVAFGIAPTAGKAVELYLIPCNDGSNYTDGSDTVPPSDNLLAGWAYVRAVTTPQRLTLRGPTGRIELPPCKFRALIRNAADQAFSAGWSLDLWPYGWQVG